MGGEPSESRLRAGSDRAAQLRGYAHAFHEAITKDILDRAKKYRHRSNRVLSANLDPANDRPLAKGDSIRARIAANAQRRFEIAQAMKAEAGVVGHALTGQLDGGLAWADRRHILAPAGENMVQLATLAHECGHIFLHSNGSVGARLPGHVKEMEAESYAHQAFAAHGMRMPSRITAWGRRYVGQWVENDRASGVRIDPRAEAFANGLRSPYEPLRRTPWQWHHKDQSRLKSAVVRLQRGLAALAIKNSTSLMEALTLIGRATSGLIEGSIVSLFGLSAAETFGLVAFRAANPSAVIQAEQYLLAIVGGLTWACIAVAWTARKRILTRSHPRRSRHSPRAMDLVARSAP